jgi:hypothetical protein
VLHGARLSISDCSYVFRPRVSFGVGSPGNFPYILTYEIAVEIGGSFAGQAINIIKGCDEIGPGGI